MNNMNVYYDGYGYVNNRGKSKYWGVAVHQNDSNKWRVAFTRCGVKYDFYFQDNANPDELVVAQIAAALYPYHSSSTAIPSEVNVGTIHGQYQITHPHRFVSSSRTGYIKQINFTSTPPVEAEVESDLPDSFNQTGAFTSLEERILRCMYKGVSTDELTPLGIKAIKTMLDTIDSKQ